MCGPISSRTPMLLFYQECKTEFNSSTQRRQERADESSYTSELYISRQDRLLG